MRGRGLTVPRRYNCKTRGTILGDILTKLIVYQGSILGYPILGKVPHTQAHQCYLIMRLPDICWKHASPPAQKSTARNTPRFQCDWRYVICGSFEVRRLLDIVVAHAGVSRSFPCRTDIYDHGAKFRGSHPAN